MSGGSSDFIRRMIGAAAANPVRTGALIICVAVANRLFTLNLESFWFDELVSVVNADPAKSLQGVWGAIKQDVHPPLYILFLHYWMKLFGTSEIAARMPSAIAGVASVFVALTYFRPVLGDRTSIIFAILFAAGFGPIWYSQEARSYSFVILFALILTGISLRLIDAVATGRTSRSTLWLFSLCATILSFLHYFGVILSCAYAITTLLSLRQRRDLMLRCLPYLALPAIPVLAWTAYHYAQLENETLGNFWIAAPRVADFMAFLKLAFGNGEISNLWLAAVPFTMAALMRDGGHTRRLALFAVSSIAVGAGLALAISLRQPMITARNLLVLLPATYLLTAMGLNRVLDFHTRGSRLVAATSWISVLFVAAIVVLSQVRAIKRDKTDWRAAADHLLSIEGCRDATILVIGAYNNGFFEFYTNGRHEDAALRLIGLGRELPPGDAGWANMPAGPCPVLLWSVRMSEDQRARLERELSARVGGDMRQVNYKRTTLFLRAQSANASPMSAGEDGH